MSIVKLTILGSPPRKSNRRIWTGKSLIKSPEAQRYVAELQRQIPQEARLRLKGPISFTAHVYYGNRQADLSAELIIDALQDQYQLIPAPEEGFTPTGRVRKRRVLVLGGVYRNDNQIEILTLYKHIDKENPRAEITIAEIEG